jgi:hypothetical protein
MYQILRLVEEIREVDLRLTKQSAGMFSGISLPMPVLDPAELGFLRTVSWLYVLYFEVGRVNVEFLTEKLAAFGHDADSELAGHRRIIQKLRTYLQHNLSPNEPQNKRIRDDCEHWLQEECGTPVPKEDDQWRTCLTGLLTDALSFLKQLVQCIRIIEKHDAREQIVAEWETRRNRYHAPHEFDELISQVASDMGRDNLDSVALRNRFYARWVRELDLLKGDYEFVVEARKLIEHVLLVETTPVLPLTGTDIMREFNIPPGPEVGRLLQEARVLNDSEPKSQSELIRLLRVSRRLNTA